MQGYLYLKRLRRQGKSCEQFVSCHAPTQSLLFDVPAWDRFFSAELINTINGFFRRLKRFGVLCHIIRSDGLIWLWSFLITTRWVLYSLILILCLTLACWHHFLLPLRKYNNLREEVGLTLGFFLFFIFSNRVVDKWNSFSDYCTTNNSLKSRISKELQSEYECTISLESGSCMAMPACAHFWTMPHCDKTAIQAEMMSSAVV